MVKNKPNDTLDRAYDALAEYVSRFGVKKSNMFGMPTLKLGRKPIGGRADDGIMFKLPVDSPEMKQALALAGAHVFAPEMHGRARVMKQWVIVPVEYEEYYAGFADASVQFVERELGA